MNTKNYLTHTKKYRLIFSAVHMVYRLVNSTYNVQEMTLRLTRLLCQFIKASSSSVYLLDPQKKKLVLIAIFDNKINILLNKRKDLAGIGDEEKKVIRGQTAFESHIIGLPLVADDNLGAIFVRRRRGEPSFTEFDKEMLAVVVEQSVTAIKNLQLHEEQQRIMLDSIEFIGKLLQRHALAASVTHMPVYFKIVKHLGERLNMGQEGIDSLYYASILHDAGIIDVPQRILAKTTKLSPQELEIIRGHPHKSVALIRSFKFLRPVLPIILYHHEKYDGSGYPTGLRREQIPMGARIMAVVDAFEAMIRHRPYKSRISIQEAISEIQKNRGSQFDPKVVDAFVDLSRQKKFRNYLNSTEFENYNK